MSPAGEKKQTTTKKKRKSWRWPLPDMTAQLQQPVPGVFVSWILMALLVSTRDKTTGADGSWTSGVAAGEAERCSSFNIRVASCFTSPLLLPPSLTFLISGADLGPLAVKYVFITSVFTEVPPCLRDWPIDHRHERGLWSHQSLIIQPSNSLPLVQSLARLPITSYSSHSAAVSLVAVTLYAVLIKASGTDVCCVLHNT